MAWAKEARGEGKPNQEQDERNTGARLGKYHSAEPGWLVLAGPCPGRGLPSLSTSLSCDLWGLGIWNLRGAMQVSGLEVGRNNPPLQAWSLLCSIATWDLEARWVGGTVLVEHWLRSSYVHPRGLCMVSPFHSSACLTTLGEALIPHGWGAGYPRVKDVCALSPAVVSDSLRPLGL